VIPDRGPLQGIIERTCMKSYLFRVCLLISFVAAVSFFGSAGCSPGQPELVKDGKVDTKGEVAKTPDLPAPPKK